MDNSYQTIEEIITQKLKFEGLTKFEQNLIACQIQRNQILALSLRLPIMEELSNSLKSLNQDSHGKAS